MEYVFSSNNDDESNEKNRDSNHEEVPWFEQFPSPFFDDIPHDHEEDKATRITTNEPLGSPKTKRGRKKRSAGKKDRHSKIHTAQGFRDRRMRLSLHIAHKFFGLQDMLGFDKASKTIEWLFCKSKKAIDEVTESVKSQNTIQLSSCRENLESYESPFSDCEDVESAIEIGSTSNRSKQPKLHDEIKDLENFKKQELRDMARARARERTREKMMINNLDQSKQAFGVNPNNNFDQSQLGFSTNPSHHHIYQDPSGTHHFDQSDLINNFAYKTNDQLGTCYSGDHDYNKHFANPPAGWLNSSNTFLGFLGGWDSESYGVLDPHHGPSITGDIHGQTLSSVLHFHTQDQRD